MRKNLKENKGITLIALIITVVVLLILAVVTISAVNDGGIFQYANNAQAKYNAATIEENSMLTDYLAEMAKHDSDNNNVIVPDDNFYNITFKDLSQNDWNGILEADKFYMIGFQDENGNITAYAIQTFAGDNKITWGQCYLPNISNFNEQYIYYEEDEGEETEHHEWAHRTLYSDPSTTIENLLTLSISNVRILTEEEVASYDMDPFPLQYESSILTKVLVEE